MECYSTEAHITRLDHLGIIAGTARSINLVELIDSVIEPDKQEKLTAGETVLALIENGLGFSNRATMLIPQFFETKPVEALIKKGIKPEEINRYKIGRVLDKVFDYGAEKLFTLIATSIIATEGLDKKFFHLDTTQFCVEGEYDEESDTQEVFIKHGFSKDHRPDLKQIGLSLLVEQESGIPLMMKTHKGNEEDSKILKERVEVATGYFKAMDVLPCIIADAKLYTPETLATLKEYHFITRVPATLKKENETINNALTLGNWLPVDGQTNKVQEFFVDYAGFKHRWVVVYSEDAHERAKRALGKKLKKEQEEARKALFHLQAKRFGCEEDAKKELVTIAKRFTTITFSEPIIKSFSKHAKKGRPSDTSISFTEYQIISSILVNQDAIDREIDQRSCFVLATNMLQEELAAHEALIKYKLQDKVEKSFSFLKDDKFFASSFFLKKESRIRSLMMVMVLALLIYSLAQRRLRNVLSSNGITIENQIKKPTSRPTLKWVFQLLEGIHFLSFEGKPGSSLGKVSGMTPLRKLILGFFDVHTKAIYQII